MTVKIRKIGNLEVLPIPEDIRVTSKEYDVYAGRDGSIIFLPTEHNPFNDINSLKKFGGFNGDKTGFVDAAVDKNELIFIQGASHVYRGKEQEVAEAALKPIQKYN